MGIENGPKYRIIHAGTRRDVRRSLWGENTVIAGLRRLVEQHPEADFLIVTEKGEPLDAARLGWKRLIVT